MAQWELVQRDHVDQAIAEYDRMGQAEFMAAHRFTVSREYLLVFGGRSYDAKAILAVAHRLATGASLKSGEFHGGRHGAARILEHFGFDVSADEIERPDVTTSQIIGDENARARWAPAAREALLDTARTYQAVVTTKELAALAQTRSKVDSSSQTHYWIGDVLARVARECGRRGEPLLCALCVDSSGSVGSRYAATVEAIRGETPADPDHHAALERLECYRHFGASLPPGGGLPALTPKLKTRRERVQSVAVANRVRPLCPIHHMEYPADGVCEECQ